MAYTTNTQLLEAIERLERKVDAQSALLVELHGWATRFLAPVPTDPRKPPVNPNGLTPGPTVEPGGGIFGAGNRPQPISVTKGNLHEVRFEVTSGRFAIDGLHSPEDGPTETGDVEAWVLGPSSVRTFLTSAGDTRTTLGSSAFRIDARSVPNGNYRLQFIPHFTGPWRLKVTS